MTPRAWPAAGVLNNKIVVLGGFDGANRLSNVEIYDPEEDRWKHVSHEYTKSWLWRSSHLEIYSVRLVDFIKCCAKLATLVIGTKTIRIIHPYIVKTLPSHS